MKEITEITLARESFNQGKYSQAVQLFEKAIINNPQLLHSGLGITLAHTLILSLNWEKVANHLPPESNILQTSGWLKSLQLGKPVNNELKPIPWYTYSAIEFIEDKIKEDFIVFEYGSGQSTLWWAEKVANLTAIESNKTWFNYLQNNLSQYSNISLNLVEDKEDYINAISSFPDQYFDVIIIDGDDRNHCVKKAHSKLKEGGFIIYDDTDREEYNEILLFLESQGFYRLDFPGMTPCLTYKNCTSVLFKDINLISNSILPSKKESCLGKSYFQKDKKKLDYFIKLDSLLIFDELKLSQYNYLISPEWNIDRQILAEKLIKAIQIQLDELEEDKTYTLFINTSNQSLESIQSFMEEIMMIVMLEYGIDIPNNFHVLIVPTLSEYQWNFLNRKISKTISI